MKYLARVCAGLFLFPVVAGFSAEAVSDAKSGLALYQQGWAQLTAQQYQAAKQTFDQSYALLPEDQKWLAQDGDAWIAYYQGDYASAEKQFSTIVARDPKAYLSYKGLGYVQLNQKAWKSATDNLIQAFTLNSHQAVTDYLYASNLLMAAQQYQDAQTILMQAKMAYPESGEVQFYLAKALWLQGKQKEAYPLLLSATYYAPVTVSAMFDALKGVDLNQMKAGLINMGWGLYVSGYYQASLYRFEQVLKLDKEDLNALRGKGFCLVQLGKYDEAQSVLTQVIQQSKTKNTLLPPVTTYFSTTTETVVPILVNAEIMLGWAQYFSGEYASAEQTFNQEIKQYPKWVNAHLGLAYALKAQGKDQYKQEMGWMNQQVPGYGVSIPEYAPQALVKGQMFYNTAWSNVLEKKYDLALKNFSQAKKLLPASYQWQVADGRAWVAYDQGKTQTAQAQFMAIIQDNPTAYLSYKGLAYIELGEKRYNEAFVHAQKLFALSPTQDAGVYAYIVKAFTDAGKSLYAEPILATGLYYYPQSGDLLFYKAKLLWMQGKKAEAYPLLLSASYYAPVVVDAALDSLTGLDVSNVKMALLNMGWGLYMVGNNQEALKRFNQYVSSIDLKNISIDDLNALRGQGFCDVRLGQYKQAIEALSAVLADSRSRQLQPLVTYAYPTPEKAIPIYVDAATMLGWAQYSAGDYSQAEKIFKKVLNQHPDWHNARLGLAYTIKAARPESTEYQKELDRINKLVPGYGQIYEPVAVSPLSVTIQGTQSWFGVNSVKHNSHAGQISLSYAPSFYLQLGGFYHYEYIHFKQSAQSSPAENTRIGYFLNGYTPPLGSVGYFGISTKGNYFIKSAYNSDGANSRLMPYVGVVYKTLDQLTSIEPGYAYEYYRDGIKTRVNQYTLSVSTLAVPNWLLSLTGYVINYASTQTPSQNNYSIAPNVTYFMGTKQSVSGSLLIGKRTQAYDLAINEVYDVRDPEMGGFGLTYTYNFDQHFSVFTNLSGERFKVSTNHNKYDACYLTFGVIL